MLPLPTFAIVVEECFIASFIAEIRIRCRLATELISQVVGDNCFGYAQTCIDQCTFQALRKTNAPLTKRSSLTTSHKRHDICFLELTSLDMRLEYSRLSRLYRFRLR